MTHDSTAKQAPASAATPASKPASAIPCFDDFADSAFARVSQLFQSSSRPGAAVPVPFSVPTYYRKVKAGLWTKPIMLSERVAAQQIGEQRALLAALAVGATDDEMRALVKKLHANRLTAKA